MNRRASSVNVTDSAALSWTMRRTKLSGQGLFAVIVAICIAFSAAVVLFHSLVFALAAGVLLLTAIIDKIVPVTYRLAADGASVSVGPVTYVEMAWADVKSVTTIPNGLKLSPFENPEKAVLESRRGVALMFDPSLAPRVEAAILQYRTQENRP